MAPLSPPLAPDLPPRLAEILAEAGGATAVVAYRLPDAGDRPRDARPTGLGRIEHLAQRPCATCCA